MPNMLFLGCDHGGFKLKQEIKLFLEKNKIVFHDLGCFNETAVDYSDIAFALANKVLENPSNKGMLFCGTGIGMSIAVNRLSGIRAALIYDDFTAKSSKEHNNANIACFGGRTQSPVKAKRWVKLWLSTSFSGDERHVRRLKKIDDQSC